MGYTSEVDDLLSSVKGDGSSGSGEFGAGDFFALFSSMVDAGTDLWINDQNLKYQKQTNSKNEELMRESWDREDTAVQRRVEDLKKAGLSPTLAAGSAAASGSPYAYIAPKTTLHGGYGSQTLAALAEVGALKNQRLQNQYQSILNNNAQLQGQLLALDVANYGLPWQLKAVNSILEHLNGKNLFETANYIYNEMQKDPVSMFVTPGSFTFKPQMVSTTAAQKATDSAVSSGRAKSVVDSDGSPALVFESKADAKNWFLDIGGTTYEWYQGIKEYGSPEEFLNWILGTGGWYFK